MFNSSNSWMRWIVWSLFNPAFLIALVDEMALVVLVDGLRWNLGNGSVSLLVNLDLTAVFNTMDCGFLLEPLLDMEMPFCSG